MRSLNTNAILLAATAGLFATTAHAAVWTGGASGAWNDSTQWDLADVPDSAVEDAVVNGTDGLDTAPTSINYGNTSLSSLTLTIRDFSLATADTMTYQSGSGTNTTTGLNVTGNMTNAGTITIRASGKSNDGTGTLSLQGTGNTFNTGIITVQGGGSGHGRSSTLSITPGHINDGTIEMKTGSSGDGANTATLSLSGSGTFTNNGTIKLDSRAATWISNSASLNMSIGSATSEAITLGGTGSVELIGRLSDGFKAGIGLTKSSSNTSGIGYLTNGANHTIFGAGDIGRNALSLTNNGLIKATNNDYQMLIDPYGTTGTVRFSNGSTGRLVSASAAEWF